MKWFTEKHGRFVMKIPLEWQYANPLAGHAEKPPYSFERHPNCIGAFQVSCYSASETPFNPRAPIQSYDQRGLRYWKAELPDPDFVILLWHAVVQDQMIMAKYVYDRSKYNDPDIDREIQLSESALSSLQVLSPANRVLALDLDRYEKFNVSLAASFDLRQHALDSGSFIELIVIVANQIDAYLRLSLVLKQQLQDSNAQMNMKYLYQGEQDSPISEREIFKQALALDIISLTVFDELQQLYDQRNRVVHRYIISRFHTREIPAIAAAYTEICETVRQGLAKLEEEQHQLGVGNHANLLLKADEVPDSFRSTIYSQVNDKHAVPGMNRNVSKP